MNLSALDLAILGSLKAKDAPVDMRTLARAVDATPEFIRHHVLKLHKQGYIHRTGGKRGPTVRYAIAPTHHKEEA